MHNHSTPLGDKARAIYYPPTGTGRDTYIMTDNGGTNINYRCQGVPETGNYLKFGSFNRSYKPCSYTRFQKYVSDGTGRDQYVVYFFCHLDPTTEGNTIKKMNAICFWESSEIPWGTVDGRAKPQLLDGKSPRNKVEPELFLSIKEIRVWDCQLQKECQESMKKNSINVERPSMENDGSYDIKKIISKVSFCPTLKHTP